jgi:heme-degrading monooxygenase HmoA
MQAGTGAQRTFAHVVSFKAPVEKLQGIGMEGFQQRVAPALQQLQGLKGTLVLLDRAGGELLGITLWDSEEHARAGDARLEQERQAGVQEMGASSAPGTIFEVLVGP